MALKLKLDSLDGLDEATKLLYVAKDGKFVLDVDGVEDTSGLKTALQKEREEAKALKDALRKFDGVDPAQFKALQEQINSSEELKLITEGKFTEVLDKRNALFQENLNKSLKAEQEKTLAAEQRAQKFEDRVLQGALSSAAIAVGVHKHALDDVLARGKSIFKLDENGVAVKLDESGKPVVGKDGKTAYTPDEWLSGMKETAPHWFPNASSGSPPGGGGGSGGDKTITRSAFTEMAPLTQAAKLKEGYVVVD